jgi:hypothetical protein
MSHRVMRAKLQVGHVQENFNWQTPEQVAAGLPREKVSETLGMFAVAASKYPDDGTDEDNTFAKWSPGANFSINIANPALWGTFHHGQKFYVDFTEAPDSAPVV